MLSNESNLDLLRKLFDKNIIVPAPSNVQRFGKHYELIIGIGDDHVAYVTIDDDAYDELMKFKHE